MRPAKRRRCDRAEQAIARLPYRREVLQEEFDLFRLAGELPEDDDRLTEVLLRRALRGGDAEDPVQMSELERLVITVVPDSYRPPKPTVRERLFDEVLCDDPFFRKAGRCGIESLVCRGGDVCDPAFGADTGLPRHGSVGMHVLGYPQRLATPPYEAQAHRLFARMDDLRDRINPDDPELWHPIGDAAAELLLTGELPPEGLLRDGALALAEYDCLWQHKRGRDVAELMAAFDAVARAEGKRRDVALAQVQALVRRAREATNS